MTAMRKLTLRTALALALLFLLGSSSWAAIVRHCHETATGISTPLAVNKPTSSSPGPSPKDVASGDLLLIVVGNDGTEAADEFDQTGAPNGFTFLNNAGNDTSDAHVAIYYRIADGSEGTTFSVSAVVSHDTWMVCFLISGTSSTPIHLTGSDVIDATPPIAITGVTTTVADCYVLAVYAYDGADDGGFSTSWTSGAEVLEVRSGTTQADAAGAVSEKQMSGTGATGTATISVGVSDGMAGFQVAIAPSGGEPPPATSPGWPRWW